MKVTMKRGALLPVAVVASLLTACVDQQERLSDEQAAETQITSALVVEGEVPTTMNYELADLLQFDRHQVEVANASGDSVVYDGVLVADLLEASGVNLGASLKGAEIDNFLTLRSGDGFVAVVSLPEFDDRVVLLADRKDGVALDPSEGPLRTIVEGAPRKARWVKNVVALRIHTAR